MRVQRVSTLDRSLGLLRKSAHVWLIGCDLQPGLVHLNPNYLIRPTL